jgi:hypothetical protein
VAGVTIDRIDALRRHIADAVTQTSPLSTLPGQEQDRILAQTCGEACELLGDWLVSQEAEVPATANEVPIRELLQNRQQFTEFLSPLFADALKRASRDRLDNPAIVKAAHDEVARAVQAVAATARRHPRMNSRQTFRVATENVGKLKAEVCHLAAQLSSARKDDARRAVWKRRAVKALKIVGGFLLTLTVSLTLSVAGPRQVSQNLSVWMHGVQVVMAHDLALQAQPGVTIAPPHAGPQLR